MCLQGRWRGQSMSSGKYKNKLSYRKHFFKKKKTKTSYKCCGIHRYVWVEGSGRKVAELKG